MKGCLVYACTSEVATPDVPPASERAAPTNGHSVGVAVPAAWQSSMLSCQGHNSNNFCNNIRDCCDVSLGGWVVMHNSRSESKHHNTNL